MKKALILVPGSSSSRKCFSLPTLFFQLLLIFFLAPSLPAQAVEKHFTLTGNQQSVKLPIRIVNNLVVVSASLNNSTPVNLILDTGTPNIILTHPKINRPLYRQKGKEIYFSGAGNEYKKLKGKVLNGLSLTMPGIEGKDLAMIVTRNPLPMLEYVAGVPIHGILGYPFFQQFIVSIDYANQMLTVSDGRTFQPDAAAEVLKMQWENTNPLIVSNLTVQQNTVPSKLMVDTGSSHYLLINHSPTGKNLGIGPRVRLGTGFGGAIYGRRGKVSAMQLADLEIRNVRAAFPDKGQYANADFQDRNGTIGGGFLHNFVVTFDYSKEVLYLKRSGKEKGAPSPGTTDGFVELDYFPLVPEVVDLAGHKRPLHGKGLPKK
jgi:hypothetical protein